MDRIPFKTIGIYQQKIRTVLIVGGGNVSYYLAKQLCDLGMQVKLIEGMRSDEN